MVINGLSNSNKKESMIEIELKLMEKSGQNNSCRIANFIELDLVFAKFKYYDGFQ